jgi:hypothetical protein
MPSTTNVPEAPEILRADPELRRRSVYLFVAFGAASALLVLTSYGLAKLMH